MERMFEGRQRLKLILISSCALATLTSYTERSKRHDCGSIRAQDDMETLERSQHW